MLHQNIFLLLGSNTGDRPGQLTLASASIEKEIGAIKVKSRIYETAPWGRLNQPLFLNQAIQVESTLSPYDLLNKIKEIELALGRTQTERWGARSIDIDIIYFDDTIINSSDLVIPHPHLADRNFVLVPLAEISPDFAHPILGKSNAKLMMECSDTLAVKEFIN